MHLLFYLHLASVLEFLRNNFKKSIQNEVVSDKPLIAVDKIQKIGERDIIQELKKTF